MSKVIDEVKHKIACGQNLYRRSTIEKMLVEYDRLLMRNTTLEKNAARLAEADEIIRALAQGEKGEMNVLIGEAKDYVKGYEVEG